MKRVPKKSALPPEEWNFSLCPEDERSACVHYEYSREYVNVRPKLLSELVGKPRPSPYHNRLVFILSKKRHPDALPMICRRFPMVPWLKLPPKTRRLLIATCGLLPDEKPENVDLLVTDDFDLSQLSKLDEIREWLFAKWMQDNRDQHDRESIVSDKGLQIEEQPVEWPILCGGPKRYYAVSEDVALAVIQIEWRWSKRQLHEAFDRLLARRPKARKQSENPPKRTGGRGFALDQLNQLGAKRLLEYYGNRENAVQAIDAADLKPGQKRPYSDGDALSTAATRSKMVMIDMINAGRFRVINDLL